MLIFVVNFHIWFLFGNDKSNGSCCSLCFLLDSDKSNGFSFFNCSENWWDIVNKYCNFSSVMFSWFIN
ncbi:hypothetical protein [Spiroplasma endosymbiont of Panzeria rudis]|uniref:hypothetical protein n=1 Tax=Spiroplasma endosymbiont of Panzeria rudis TaxID=3066301 RepID=UPI0030CD782E